MAKLPHTYHHYVPQVYLKKFASTKESGKDEIVHVRFNGNGKFFPRNVASICGYDNLYTIPNIVKGLSQEDRLAVEKEFYGRRIERSYNSVYQKMINDDFVDLSKEDKNDILFTVISFFFRNKIHFDTLEQEVAEHISFLKGFISRQKMEQTSREVLCHFNKRKYTFKANEINTFEKELYDMAKFDFLVGQLDGLNEAVKLKINCGISISKLVVEDFEYITSDNPISLYKMGGEPASIRDEDCIITFPINGKYLLKIYPPKDTPNPNKIGRIKGDRNDALVNNLLVEKNSQSWIIGNDKSIVKHEKDQILFGEDNQQNRDIVEEVKERVNYLTTLYLYTEKIGIRLYDPYLYTMVIEGIKRGYLKQDPNFSDFVDTLESQFYYQFTK